MCRTGAFPAEKNRGDVNAQLIKQTGFDELPCRRCSTHDANGLSAGFCPGFGEYCLSDPH